MVIPAGFWLAANPNPNPDDVTFAQHNMNHTLLQKGDITFLNSVLSKHGVSGYNETLGIFLRRNSTGGIDKLPVIVVGNDADKPDESTANNDAWYFAIDTLKLYVISSGTRYTISGGGQVALGGSPVSINPDDAAIVGISATGSHSDHQHAIGAMAPINIGVANAEGNSVQFSRGNHVHNHPANMHERGAARELNGDHLDIDFNPSTYSPDSSISEAGHVDDLSAHLKGIDNKLKNITISNSAPGSSDGNNGDIWLEY